MDIESTPCHIKRAEIISKVIAMEYHGYLRYVSFAFQFQGRQKYMQVTDKNKLNFAETKKFLV